MIIKCQYCKREFDKKSQCKQHERDAHKNMPWIDYNLQKLAEKVKKEGAPHE